MDRATFKLVMAIGVLLNSALYLGAIVLVGLITSQLAAVYLAIAAFGVSYLSYCFNFAADEADLFAGIARNLVGLSVFLGVVAGIWLVVAGTMPWVS